MGRKRKGAIVLPSGIHEVKQKRSDGSLRVAYYWRPGRGTKGQGVSVRLPNDPTKPDFWTALELAQKARDGLGSLGRMIVAYKASPKFAGLAAATRRDYARYLDEMLAEMGALDADQLTTPHIAALRDRFGSTPSKADHYVKLIRAAYSWGVELGFAPVNPAVGVSSISKGTPYEPWSQGAWDLVPEMREETRMACVLGLYTGQRLGDVLRMRLVDIAGETLHVHQSKTGKSLHIPFHRDLRDTIRLARDRAYICLVSKHNGQPFSTDQFHAMWGRDRACLKVRAMGFTFHGLRKSATVMLIEAGCTASEAAAITGHSLRELERYAAGADQIRLARVAMEKVERA